MCRWKWNSFFTWNARPWTSHSLALLNVSVWSKRPACHTSIQRWCTSGISQVVDVASAPFPALKLESEFDLKWIFRDGTTTVASFLGQWKEKKKSFSTVSTYKVYVSIQKKGHLAGFKAKLLIKTPLLEAILVIFGPSLLIVLFESSKLRKITKWHNFCVHAQWWSPWRPKNVEKVPGLHLASSNLNFYRIATDNNGFKIISQRKKEEG